jgi:hypothetical protein
MVHVLVLLTIRRNFEEMAGHRLISSVCVEGNRQKSEVC